MNKKISKKNRRRIFIGLIVLILLIPLLGFLPSVASPWNWFFGVIGELILIAFLFYILGYKKNKKK